MSLGEFLSNNYVMIYELIGLEILLLVGAHISFEMKCKTLIAASLLFIELICYTTERWTQSFEVYSIMRPLLTAVLYSIYPLIIITLMQITTTNMSRRNFWLLMIPELICVPLFFSSQWTHLVFVINYPNNYGGGPLADLPYWLFMFYVVIFLIHNFIYLKHSTRMNRIIAAYITIGPLLGAFGFLLFKVDKDYSSLFTSGILLYFAYIYIYMAKIDPLTGLLNRQSFYQDMENNAREITGVVSIDMNDLKYLNDSFGHQAGDDALMTVAGIFKENSGRNAFVYRIGGDEFMILYLNSKEEEVSGDIKTIRAAMDKTEYVCAYGYAMVTKEQDLSEAIRISDQLMYSDKAALKKIRNLNAMVASRE